MKEIKKYGLIRASKKTGKIDKLMTGLGCGLIKLWGLQNTTASKITFVFELDTGDIVAIYRGVKGDNFPNVTSEFLEPENIEEYCPGILLSMIEEDEA